MASLRWSSDIPDMSDQFYCLIYDENPEQRELFQSTRKPPSTAIFIRDKRVRGLLCNNEPGPTIDYDSLRFNLTQIQQNLYSSRGQGLAEFFRTLLQSRATWQISTVKFHMFEAYTKMLTLYYIDQRRELAAQVDYSDPDYQAYECECERFLSSNAPDRIRMHHKLLHAEYHEATRALTEIKESKNMVRNAAVLWDIIKEYDRVTRVVLANKKYVEDQAQRVEEKDGLKRRNVETQSRQMGMQMASQMDDSISTEIVEWMKEKFSGPCNGKNQSQNPK